MPGALHGATLPARMALPMEFLIALLVATAASFIGSLQAGLVNTAVLAVALRHGPARARRTALGGALPELLYAAIAFVAADQVLAFTAGLGITPGRVTGVVLVAVGLYVGLFMRPFRPAEEPSRRGGFWLGLLLGLMNPQLALFWCGVRIGMETLGMGGHGWASLAGFSLGAFLGAMGLLLLLIRFAARMQQRLSGQALAWIFRGLGLVLVAVGAWAWLAG